jgi:ABC-2 type transport system ATP-binding protein
MRAARRRATEITSFASIPAPACPSTVEGVCSLSEVFHAAVLEAIDDSIAGVEPTSEDQMPAVPTGRIVAEDLYKRYRVKTRDPGLRGALVALLRPRYRNVEAVRDVSFTIDAGEMVAFLGPNGAGKTTTIKMLSGLLHPDGGRAEVAGFEPWSGGPRFKQRIALVLGNKQQLVWDLPPEETFLLNRAIYAIPQPQYRERLDELVELLGLADLLDKPVRQLSQGERMKCELAAALLHGPEVLFLDEPTLGLDVAAQDAIRRFLRVYRDRSGATVLLTSHYMGDVAALASRVLIINKGLLLYDGALRDLVTRANRRKRIDLVLGKEVARNERHCPSPTCRSTSRRSRTSSARCSPSRNGARPPAPMRES